MAEPSRLALLPGYDTAPDVYETPDLPSDDTSTTVLTQETFPRSPSETEDSSADDEEEDEEESYGVSRRRLYPQRARSRFSATSGRVETRGVDLSDRVDGRRRGYKVRRRRVGEVDDGDEGLGARIARLRREIEECRAEAQEASQHEGDAGAGVDELATLLAGIEVPSGSRQVSQAPAGANGARPHTQALDEDITDEQTLSRVANFDSRLSALEQTLGISSLDAATSDAVSAPLLPSLSLLDQQLSALSSATSLANLEAASSRISKLRVEANQLHEDCDASEDIEGVVLSPEDKQRLDQLYTLLPNLQSLAPTIPALINRLRSLRALHTTAANAASELEDVEKRQAEMEKELKSWRQGLEKLETAMRETAQANGKNGMQVNEWVNNLSRRIDELARR
jgi:nuclear migration protein JNM1